jgi:hypothetical protein
MDSRTEFLSDILTTAVEGGISYWSAVHQYQYELDGEIRVHVGEREGDEPRATVFEINDAGDDFNGTRHEITLDVILRGVRIASQIDGYDVVREATSELDAGMIDANLADDIVQLGLFGLVVYG